MRCVACCSLLVVGALLGAAWAWQTWPHICCPHFRAIHGGRKLPPPRGPHGLCPVPSELRLQDLQDKGYVVVPGFLSEAQWERAFELYHRLPPDPPGLYYHGQAGYKDPGLSGVDLFEFMPSVMKGILALIYTIQNQTDIRIIDGPKGNDNLALRPVFVHTNNSVSNTIRFSWHQDAGSYHDALGDHYNYLNFYLMLDKARPDEAGLDVVPFDVLRERSPEMYRRTVRGGATKFLPAEGPPPYTVMIDELTDHRFILDFNITDFSCVPRWHRGDLLVLRGDAYHRTQPHHAHRTSLSIRIFPRPHVNVDWLFNGGLRRYTYLKVNRLRWSLAVPNVLDKVILSSRILGGYHSRQLLKTVRVMLEPLLGEPRVYYY